MYKVLFFDDLIRPLWKAAEMAHVQKFKLLSVETLRELRQ